jgi:hypothetical protein
MANPNTARITDPMWRMWTDRPDSTWKLGGIFANKKCYHNTVDENLRLWPGGYCVRFSLDLNHGPRDKARAIDYTMGPAKIKKYTGRLVRAADRNDPRMRPVRDFYGTVDGNNVIGRIRDNDTENYRWSSSDTSHLWHIHISFWAAFVNNWVVLSGVLSVLRGESLSEWKRGGTMIGLTIGDSGEPVKGLQSALNRAGFNPGTVDGDYGPNTADALLDCRKSQGSTAKSGATVTGHAHTQLLSALIDKRTPKATEPTDAQISKMVGVWVTSNLNKVIPVAEIEERVARWLESNRESLKGDPGEPGKTPTKITITGDVVEVI